MTTPAIPVLPNVLRNAAAPNTLRGMTVATAQGRSAAAAPVGTRQLRGVALVVGLGLAIVIALVGLGRV